MAGKATIIYALADKLVELNKEATELRERGSTIRFVSLNEFRGETETNAGAVFVTGDASPAMRDAVAQAYPHLEIESFSGFSKGFDPFKAQSSQAEGVDGDVKQLRMRLVQLGGTVPSGASAGALAALIVAQEAGLDRIPVLPTPGNQGTVIPDSTPTMAKTLADSRVDTAATGSTAAVIKANEGEEGLQGDRAGSSTPTATAGEERADGTTVPTEDEVAAADERRANRSKNAPRAADEPAKTQAAPVRKS